MTPQDDARMKALKAVETLEFFLRKSGREEGAYVFDLTKCIRSALQPAPVGGDDATKAINEIQAAAGVMYDHLNKVNGEIAINGLSQIMEATLLLRRALSSPPDVVSNKTQNTVHKDSCDQSGVSEEKLREFLIDVIGAMNGKFMPNTNDSDVLDVLGIRAKELLAACGGE